MSDAYSTLVHAALLGTDHRARAERITDDSDLGQLVNHIAQADVPGALLSEAALRALNALAGRTPALATAAPGTPAPTENADHKVVHPGLASQLTSMLADVNAEVLPEWLDAVATRGWRAPWISLPALLHLGARRAHLRPLIGKVLGARGRWLASQNVAWSYGIEHPLENTAVQEAWAIASVDERTSLLEQVRSRDAALGRQLVESTWAEDAPAARKALITVLRTGLDSADEPFLERALDDRRQEVRQEAAALLMQLPDSALVARMASRALALVSLQGATLSVDLPVECDAAMARDGIARKPDTSKGLGERAWWLMQIVGAVPPQTWTDMWHTTPAETIALAVQGEWEVALMSGWSVAARTHRDAEWANALLRAGVESGKAYSHAPSEIDLMDVMGTEQREAFVAQTLLSQPAALSTIDLIAGMHHEWSVPFARTALQWLAARIAATEIEGSAVAWRLAQILPGLALHMPPALATDAEAACRTEAELTSGLPRAIDRFTAVLAFRHALYQELDK